MNEDHYEKKISGKTVYSCRIFTVTEDTVLLENGETAERDIVYHHGGAAIIPYHEDGTVSLVKQYRYALRKEIFEIPAGKLEAGEDPFEAAKRELEEECGLTADTFIPLGEIYPTVGYDSEIIYMWAAKGLHKVPMHLDSDEFLTPLQIPLEQVYNEVMEGRIRDAKTVAGILKLHCLISEGKF